MDNQAKMFPTAAVVDTGVSQERLATGALLSGVNLSGEGSPETTADDNGHGTAVAATILRVAGWARIVPVKLMGKYGYLRSAGQLEVAFEWIVEHQAALAIQVVCAAFADTSHLTTDAHFRDSPLQRHVAALRAAGVATVTPAGNAYRSSWCWSDQGMAWPAILREVISVGAVRNGADGLYLTQDTQRLHAERGGACRTTVFAEPEEPGESSGAAAVVAGHLLALRTAHPHATVDKLEVLLRMHCRVARDASTFRWPAITSAPCTPGCRLWWLRRWRSG